MSSETKCVRCGATVPWDSDRCPKCRSDVGAPNVRLIDTPEEKRALQTRYEAAMADAEKRGALNALRRFEEVVLKSSRAVINVNVDFLWNFLQKRSFYTGYQILTDNKIRKPARYDDDRRRRSVDALLHGGLADRMIFSALWLNGAGLCSYGAVALTISEQTTSGNATLLEENSFKFVSNHALLPEQPLPLGYRCNWADRAILATAKLAGQISPDTDDETFASLVLKSDGTRCNDEFIEVHIYGPFDSQAVESIVIQTRSKLGWQENQLLKNARDLAEREGISWNEHGL